MERHLKKLPKDILDLICRARDISGELGMPAFLVGGFVRDLLLSRANYDLDIAVEGQGIEFAGRFCAGVDCRLVTHRRFGTATVSLNREDPCGRRHFKIDFASTRRETYPRPAALPVVSPSTLRDDLFRRDFTINTLAVSLSAGEFGRLLDVFGGKEDLESGLIRVLHEKSFIDDPTRILRAVRFEQRFGFRIEPRTLRLLKDAAGKGMLEKVQPQRLRDELLLIFKEDFPEKAVTRLGSLAGFGFISPRVKADGRTARLFSRVRGEAAWFREHCASRRHLDLWVMYLAALLYGLAPKEAREVCRRFGFGRGESSRIISAVSLRKKVERTLSRGKVMRRTLFRLLDPLPYEVILLIRAASASRNARRHIADFFLSCHGTCVCITGHDLRRLGIEPGPEYQRIFGRILDAKLEGRLATREDELRFAARMRKDCP